MSGLYEGWRSCIIRSNCDEVMTLLTPKASRSRDKIEATGSIGGSRGTSSMMTVGRKIDWLVKQ